ncbi:MAG: hypothetical protein LC798_13730 [Chloroflexi bacterium]|nr:hypothetical protein [Chloroflexota bacterium]
MSKLSGTIIDQHTGEPVRGASVKLGSLPTVTTDANGQFDVPGDPDTNLRSLTISKTGYFTRKTKTRSGQYTFGIVASSFDMVAFDDVSRQEYGSATRRWMADPSVFVDTRPRGFNHPDMPKWCSEIATQTPEFIEQWSRGDIGVAKITLTDTPPPDLTAGTIVIRLSENDADYGGGPYIGYALQTMLSNRSIVAGTVHMRYKKYATNPGKRRGILAHELGHIFGMHHMSGTRQPSLMQPSLGSRTDLLAFDHLIAAFHYDREPANYSPDTYSTKKRGVAKAPKGAPPRGGRNIPNAMTVKVREWVCGE